MAGGIGAIVAYLGANSRSIGTIIPDVVIEEAHRDSMVITQHPVETGAAITDHAFATPSSVVIRAGFSNSSAGSEGYARQIYQTFLAWRKSRDPRDVSTGKRRYKNMLPADISVITDARTENILALTVVCQEVLITSTQTTGAGTGSDTTKSGDSSSAQGDAKTTGDTLNSGPQQGIGTGSQSFAGAFEPGNTNIDGGTVPDGKFGLNGIEAGSGAGIAPSTVTTEVGPMTGQDPSTGAIIFDDNKPTPPIFGPGAIGGP